MCGANQARMILDFYLFYFVYFIYSVLCAHQNHLESNKEKWTRFGLVRFGSAVSIQSHSLCYVIKLFRKIFDIFVIIFSLFIEKNWNCFHHYFPVFFPIQDIKFLINHNMILSSGLSRTIERSFCLFFFPFGFLSWMRSLTKYWIECSLTVGVVSRQIRRMWVKFLLFWDEFQFHCFKIRIQFSILNSEDSQSESFELVDYLS